MRRLTLATLAVALLLPGTTPAAGLYLYEYGAPGVGLASAGYAARAGDAETLFTNPAGMARLGGMELLVGAQALYGRAQLTPSAATTTTGGDGGNAVGWLPGGSAFYVASPTADLKLGVGALNYFGLGLEYQPGWAGRYFGQKGTLLGLSILPTMSYRVTDALSVGAGLNAMYATMRGALAVNNPLSAPDGALDYSSSAWGFGANLGVLLDAGPGTRVGLAWLTQVKLDFKAVPTFSGLSPGLAAIVAGAGLDTTPLRLGMTAPNRFMLGVHQQLGPRWAVMGDVGYEQWSQFGMMEVTFDAANPASLTKAIGYKDAWHVAAGAQYRPSAAWSFSGGAAWDGSMMPDEDRTVLTPLGAALRFSLGVQWTAGQGLVVGLQDTFVWGGSMPLRQERGATVLDGTYRDSLINMVALNLRWLIG